MILNHDHSFIENMTVTIMLNIINSLEQSFYLTGSRFFENAYPNSDWDFFTSDTIRTRITLKNLGFNEIPTEEMVDMGYDKNQFSSIYELACSDGIIQVQLIRNVQAKLKVQDRIKDHFLQEFNSLSKQNRKKLWTLLLNIAGPMY